MTSPPSKSGYLYKRAPGMLMASTDFMKTWEKKWYNIHAPYLLNKGGSKPRIFVDIQRKTYK
jgi:hypothetical protein